MLFINSHFSGLPFAALVTGSMYFARTRLPENLQFGPKRWPFYALIAVGSMTAANLLSMNNCGQRVKPKMYEMYQKVIFFVYRDIQSNRLPLQYTTNQPNQTTTYESLRAANRQYSSQPSYGVTANPQEQYPPIGDSLARPSPPLPPKSGYLYEDAPTISGTPFIPNPDTLPPPSSGDRSRGSSNSYGDKGFS